MSIYETMEQELERQSRRLGPEIFKPVVVRNLIDLKKAVYDLDPKLSPSAPTETVSVGAEGIASDDNGVQRHYRVSADLPSQSRRDILMAGFLALREKMAIQDRLQSQARPIMVNGRPMKSPLIAAVDCFMWVDPLLRRWLGATRKGLDICWEIEGYRYKYDIFTHSLSRAKLQDKK